MYMQDLSGFLLFQDL